MAIGFIGLGTMGASMASNLQRAGHQLVVHDVRKEAAAPHVAAGAAWAGTAREVGEAAELVFTSLPGPAEVEAVALGEDGLLAGMRPGDAFYHQVDLNRGRPHWGEVCFLEIAVDPE